MRHLIILGLAAAYLSAPVAQANEEECSVRLGFETEDDAGDWRAVNDGVMGGRSSGGPVFMDDFMRFSGVINTNGGGFSSVRTFTRPGVLAGSEGFAMMVRTDGRDYNVTLRTDMTYRGRQVSFRASLPDTQAEEWSEIFVPFSELEPTLFGRSLGRANFNASEVRDMGFILADGQDGPFEMDIKWIKGCKAP